MTSKSSNSGNGEHTLEKWHRARRLPIWTVSHRQARGVCVLTLCVYTQYVYQCVLYCTCRACESYICSSLFKEHSMSLLTSASTYSVMAEKEPLTWFSNATNVFHVQRIWPWNCGADETTSKWARLAYRVLCLTPTAAEKGKSKD